MASAAYTLARAANADMDISAEETAVIEAELQSQDAIDEPTAVLVTEMAKLQAKTVGSTEDYVVTREFRNLSSEAQRIAVAARVLRDRGRQRDHLRRGERVLNEIGRELDLDPATVNAVRADFHDKLSAVQEVRRVAGTN